MKKRQFIGREKEKGILKNVLVSDEAEMVAVIGRRRVGKTFLINTVFENHIAFEMTGVQNAPLKRQLKGFAFQLSAASGDKVETPKDWFDAFLLLIEFLKTKQAETEAKQVVFLDELPWLASPRSGFLQGLSFFWNNWAVKQNIVVVICGSAASWMIQKVVNHKGGLHNRITKTIHLEPFSLSETEFFLKSNNVFLDKYQMTQLYMAIGGIPHYLKEIKAGKSFAQNINAICFARNGLLKKEFSRLYPALFKNSDKHISVIRALARKWSGLKRGEIIEATGFSDGGGLNRILEELEYSGFISAYYPFGKKKKERIYRLTDEYSLFYLHFIESQKNQETDVWQKLSQTQKYKNWSGYAFESLCLKHIQQIKKALGISGIYSEASTYYQKGNHKDKGLQIDLLIDRNDHVINLFEIKFYAGTYQLTKAYAQNLRSKMEIFRNTTKTKKQIFWTMITTFGIAPNEHSIGLVEQTIILDDLFE